jgi:CRP-like cAMP-binding protein
MKNTKSSTNRKTEDQAGIKVKMTAASGSDSSDNRLLHMIDNCSYFDNLTADDIERVKRIFFRRTMRKNEYFLSAGSCLEYLGYVSKGMFRYYYIDADANDITKYFVSENDFVFSLSSFISHEPSLFYIEAIEDAELMCASVTDIRALISSSTVWLNIYRNILETTYVIKERREAEFLLYDARQRYNNFLHEYPEMENRIKQHYIASFLGITPESLSRIRAQLQKS